MIIAVGFLWASDAKIRQARSVEDELKRTSCLRLGPIHLFPFEWIPRVLPVRYSARITPEVPKTVLDKPLIHQHAGGAAEVRAIDDDLLLPIERSRACFRLSKWIEPGIRLARNIQSSKQLISLKSSPRSSFSFNSSRVIVIIDKICYSTCYLFVSQRATFNEWHHGISV